MKTHEEIEKTLEDKVLDALGWVQVDRTFAGRMIATKLLKAAILEAIRDTVVLENKNG